MKKFRIVAIPTAVLLLVVLGGGQFFQHRIAGRIATSVQLEMPNATGVSASIPLGDVPSNLASDSIKTAHIAIEKFVLAGSKIAPALSINATNISKSQPTVIGNLDVTVTISAATLTRSSGFDNAKIVGNALQVSVGSGGMGEATLIPKYSNSQLYFELQKVSFLGNEIPASSLPVSVRDQVKTRSLRTLAFPEALQVKSVSLDSGGLSFKMHGSNIEIGNLA